MHYQMYQDELKKWRWRLIAADYYAIADSTESYDTQEKCRASIILVKQSQDAPILYLRKRMT